MHKHLFAVIVIVLIIAVLPAGCTSSTTTSSSPSATAAHKSDTYLTLRTNDYYNKSEINILPDVFGDYNTITAMLSINSSGGSSQHPTARNKTIQWFIDGKPIGANTTDVSGEADLSLASIQPLVTLGRNFTVRAQFAGDETLSPSSETTTLTPYIEYNSYQSMVYNQTVGLVQSGNFPALDNAARFTGEYVSFSVPDVQTKDNVPMSVVNSFRFGDRIFDASSTVFLVKATKLDKVGDYYWNNTGGYAGSGYNARFDIYVIKYPEKAPIGKYTLTSAPPEKSSSIVKVASDVVGTPKDWQDWIKTHTVKSSQI